MLCFSLALLAALSFGFMPINAQVRSNAVRGLDPTKPISEYRQSIWTVNNGLPQNSALTLCQTRDGYLWIGTQEGIARFDGLKFRVFGKHRCWRCAVELRVDGALTPHGVLQQPPAWAQLPLPRHCLQQRRRVERDGRVGGVHHYALLVRNVVVLWAVLAVCNRKRVSGFRWRTSRLRAKAEELERLVDVRTREVQEQAKEIQLANTELSEKNLKLSTALHQLQATQAQLVHAEKMAGLGQVTAGVAHEINNPVSFIAAALPMLKEDLESVFDVLRAAITLSPQSTGEEFSRLEALKRERDLDALLLEIYEFLDTMKIGAKRIAEIVRSLGTFSRLNEDVLKLANLHDGLDSTLVILRNQYSERICVEKHYQADLPAVQCYPGQINQVFMNVLANAVQAIEGQGVIAITTHVVDALVDIRISDTGAGMSPEVQARAFEPFYTTKGVGKGTGLGLSISLGIVERHHGTIRLDSVLGKGTTVEIRLPFNQPKA